MKAIGIDNISYRVSKQTIILCALLCTIAAFLIVCVMVHQSEVNDEFNANCRAEAIKWNSQLHKYQSNSHDPFVMDNLAMELARARIACPNGHSLIDERRIPVKVLELSNEVRIVESAKKHFANL